MLYYRHTDLLLSLLRLALWDDREPFTALGPISEDEWSVAFYLAANHTVQGLAWQGICKLEDKDMPPKDLLYIWTAKVAVLEQASANMNSALAQLMSLLQGRGLHPIVMKGQCAAALYDKPQLRECGDIDLYFQTEEEFRQSREVLGNCAHTADGCYRTSYMGIEVEIHPRFIDISNPFVAPVIRKMLNDKPFTQIEAAPGLVLTGAAPEVNLIALSTHIMKHSFGRGIGLRQMCDLAMACARYHGTIDKACVAQTSKALKLERWDRLAYSFLAIQLGMPEEYLPYDIELTKSHTISDRILFGGNFGRMAHDTDNKNTIARKGETAMSMIRNSFWTLRCSPLESFFHFSRLALGQFKR